MVLMTQTVQVAGTAVPAAMLVTGCGYASRRICQHQQDDEVLGVRREETRHMSYIYCLQIQRKVVDVM
jgi:hypothetical protein